MLKHVFGSLNAFRFIMLRHERLSGLVRKIFLADKGRSKKTYFCMVLFVSLAFSRRLIQKRLVFELFHLIWQSNVASLKLELASGLRLPPGFELPH